MSTPTADEPHIKIHVIGVEDFVGVVELLMEAGAQGLGRRVFEVRPPLSVGQVDALRMLSRYERGGVTVTVEPPDADVWQPDPAKVDPVVDDDEYAWWERHNNGRR